MSFGFPSVKPKPEHPLEMEFKEGNFGVPDLMSNGLGASTPAAGPVHPVAHLDQNYKKNKHDTNMTILRGTQGLHAPLRIAMEMKAVKQVGHLPFLPSYNVLYDSLTGRDLEVGPEDLFNHQEFKESMVQPHAAVERSLGLL